MTNEAQHAVDEGVRAEIIETVRRFVQREVIPVASELERTDTFPTGIVEQMKSSVSSGSPFPRPTAALGWTCSPTSG